jgi:hypothetical protein
MMWQISGWAVATSRHAATTLEGGRLNDPAVRE